MTKKTKTLTVTVFAQVHCGVEGTVTVRAPADVERLGAEGCWPTTKAHRF
jgi:hypothetical protein